MPMSVAVAVGVAVVMTLFCSHNQPPCPGEYLTVYVSQMYLEIIYLTSELRNEANI